MCGLMAPLFRLLPSVSSPSTGKPRHPRKHFLIFCNILSQIFAACELAVTHSPSERYLSAKKISLLAWEKGLKQNRIFSPCHLFLLLWSGLLVHRHCSFLLSTWACTLPVGAEHDHCIFLWDQVLPMTLSESGKAILKMMRWRSHLPNEKTLHVGVELFSAPHSFTYNMHVTGIM